MQSCANAFSSRSSVQESRTNSRRPSNVFAGGNCAPPARGHQVPAARASRANSIVHLHELTPTSTGLVWNVSDQPKQQHQPGKLNTPSKADKACSGHSSSSGIDSSDGVIQRTRASAGAPTVDLMRINATFRRYSQDGTVHHDDVTECLKRLGFAQPHRQWVDRAFASSSRSLLLDPAEFILFVAAFEDHLREFYYEEFNRYVADNGMDVDKETLVGLLNQMHLETVPHVLQEVFLEVDKDGNELLDFDEFFEVIRLLRERVGFTKKEHDDFLEAFALFDRDRSGEMDEQELQQLLTYLGYEVTEWNLQATIQEVDFDGTGTLDHHELLVCMSRFRLLEMQALKAAIVHNDVDTSAPMVIGDAQTVLSAVGYFPEEQVTREILEDMRADDASGPPSWVAISQFMVELRQRDQLSRDDQLDVEQAFNRYVANGEVSTTDVSKILRFMGYNATYDERQAIVTQVDVDSSGTLEQSELRKMLRIVRTERSKKIDSVYKAAQDDHIGVMPTRCVVDALRNVGVIVVDGGIKDLHLDDSFQLNELGGLDFREFMRLCRRKYLELDTTFRWNSDYSSEEIGLMRQSFKAKAQEGISEVRNSDLVDLVKTAFPEINSDPKLRPQLKDIVREAEEDPNSTIDFDDFLRLVRAVCDMRNKNQLIKEKQAITDSGFDGGEVIEFRELFRERINKSMMLDFEVFEDMISHFCPLGDRNRVLLASLWREALMKYDSMNGMASGEEDPHNMRISIDFPEMLWLVRRILDTNFANVLERTKKVMVASADGSGVRTSV